MKLGLGLYRNLLTPDNFRFARQAGATHIVAHLLDYDSDFPKGIHSGGTAKRDRDSVWSDASLRDLKAAIQAEGLELAAIENFEPAHWCDVLLDGPCKQQQLTALAELIRRVGNAGIPVFGYYFSLAGVWGLQVGPFARGSAESVAFLDHEKLDQTPLPAGQVWNMVPDADTPPPEPAQVTSAELWQRLADFLEALVPVAEQAGVTLAAHPDDPPLPTLRGTPRLVHHPDLWQRLLDIVPSPANAIEFCMGTVQEMAGGSVYEALDKYSRQGKIAYIHCRNVRGKVPHYREVFIDEGDIDMLEAFRVLAANGYDGVLIPDHTPLMSCPASWHAGMAYALGFMRAAIRAVTRSTG